MVLAAGRRGTYLTRPGFYTSYLAEAPCVFISQDPEAVKSIHEFLAFQRGDHRAAGHAAH